MCPINAWWVELVLLKMQYIVYIDSGEKNKIKEKSLVNSNSANYMDILSKPLAWLHKESESKTESIPDYRI